MDCKIISRLFFLIIFFTTSQLNAIEFKGKFLQGHYIVGITDPAANIIVDKKEVRVSKDGYFVFGIDRDRKFDISITKIINGKKEFNRGNETKIHKNSFLKLKKLFRKKYPQLSIELKLISLNQKVENFR